MFGAPVADEADRVVEGRVTRRRPGGTLCGRGGVLERLREEKREAWRRELEREMETQVAELVVVRWRARTRQ
jgi:hypothetical protein